jgi:excisionase family DNA binding protein
MDAHLMCMRIQQTPLHGLDPLLSVEELSDYLGVPIRTIYDWRQTGHGPRGIRIGRHLKFAVSDVMAWIDAQREASSSRDRAQG